MHLQPTAEQTRLAGGGGRRFARGLRPLLEADPEWWRQGMLSDGDSAAVNRALGAAGWIGMSWPEELGGRGLSRLTATLVEEVFGYHWLPLSSYLLSYKTIGAAIERFGSPELVERLLPPIARGELVFCQGFSEPGAGSDLGSLTTRAELRRRHLRRQRPQDLDVQRAARRLDLPRRPHRHGGQRSTAASRCSSARSTRPGSRCDPSRRSAAAPSARSSSTASRSPSRTSSGPSTAAGRSSCTRWTSSA